MVPYNTRIIYVFENIVQELGMSLKKYASKSSDSSLLDNQINPTPTDHTH